MEEAHVAAHARMFFVRSSDVERRPARSGEEREREWGRCPGDKETKHASRAEVPARQEMLSTTPLRIAWLSLSVYLAHVLVVFYLHPEPPVLLAS